MSKHTSCARCWSSGGTRAHKWLARRFNTLGRAVGTYPRTVLVVSLAVAAACSVGLLQLTEETDIEKLWVPTGTASVQQRAFVDTTFGAAPEAASTIAVATGTEPVLGRASLLAQLDVHERVVSAGSGYHTVCFPDVSQPGSPCKVANVLVAWDFNRTRLQGDPSPLATVSALPPDVRTAVLGGVTVDSGGMVVSAKAVRSIYFVTKSPAATLWQKAFLDATSSCRACAAVQVEVLRSCNAAFDIELERAVNGDMALVLACFGVMAVYTCSALGKGGVRASRAALGVCGLLSVVLSIAMAFGICAAAGVMFSSLTQVLPFLIIGLGVDDMFVLVACMDSVCKGRCVPATLSERIGDAMAKAGPAITMTSLTSCLAFAVSTFANLPAVSAFAVYAAVAVATDFAMQVTFFAACMALDVARMDSGRMDCLCCIKLQPKGEQAAASSSGGHCGAPARADSKPPPNASAVAAGSGSAVKASPATNCSCACSDGGSNRAVTAVAQALMHPVVIVATIVLSIAACAASTYLATHLSQGIAIPDDIVMDDSFLVPFAKSEARWFDTGITVDIVIEPGVPYHQQAVQQQLGSLVQSLDASQYAGGPTQSWLAALKASAPQVSSMGAAGFYEEVARFLNTSDGAVFRPDVVLARNGTGGAVGIVSSRFLAQERPLSDTLSQKAAMLEWRALCAASPQPAFAYSFDFLFLEQYLVIVQDTVWTLAASAVCMFVVALAFLVVPSAPVVVMVVVLMVQVDVLGVMVLWDVKLNSVSLAVLVLGLGISIDYSAHLVHAFMEARGTDRRARVIKALRRLAPSIVHGSVSTLLGVIPLAFAGSSVFTVFFRILFSLVSLSAVHAFVVLPAFLAVCGPRHALQSEMPPCYVPPPDDAEKLVGPGTSRLADGNVDSTVALELGVRHDATGGIMM